jgi:hypothetical protein
MLATTCPSCGAELHFRSSVTVSAVCASCGSLVLRTDVKVEAIGAMASLPDDISPLQVGTDLTIGGRRYTILGRVRMYWADGAWNEWFMDDGATPGWLIEAQGFFSVAFPLPMPPGFATNPWPALGTAITIDGVTYHVTDLKQATCAGSEGELPFTAPRGRQVRYADLTGADGGFAGLEEAEDGRTLYVGRNIHFDDVAFNNLRGVEGWIAPAGDARLAGDPEYSPGP